MTNEFKTVRIPETIHSVLKRRAVNSKEKLDCVVRDVLIAGLKATGKKASK